ncbi:Serum response factor like protein A [Cucumispora dikerogammari]|nr:Serum response factor like protein A [Cucumispora dikerogammari]
MKENNNIVKVILSLTIYILNFELSMPDKRKFRQKNNSIDKSKDVQSVSSSNENPILPNIFSSIDNCNRNFKEMLSEYSTNEKEVVEETPTKSFMKAHYIEDFLKRTITFNKRKQGLMKKAMELTKLTGCEIFILCSAEKSNCVYTVASDAFREIISKKHFREEIENSLENRKNHDLDERFLKNKKKYCEDSTENIN